MKQQDKMLHMKIASLSDMMSNEYLRIECYWQENNKAYFSSKNLLIWYY